MPVGARVHYRHRMRRLFPVLLAAGLTLAACGSSDDGGGGDQAGDSSCEVQVRGEVGAKPEILIPENCAPPTELQITDIDEGQGDPVEAGDDVVVDYELYAWSTRSEVESTWEIGSPFNVVDVGQPTANVIPGWNEGLIGAKQFGRRLLIVPPDKAYGEAGSSTNQLAGETLVFVLAVDQIIKGDAADQ